MYTCISTYDQFRESMKKSTAVGIFFIDSVRLIYISYGNIVYVNQIYDPNHVIRKRFPYKSDIAAHE